MPASVWDAWGRELGLYARLLSGRSIRLHPLPAQAAVQAAHLEGDDWLVPGLHAVAQPQRRQLALAMLAHAAAHQSHGAPAASRIGLKPVQQLLVGVLEDARVEAVAMRRMPGLRRLWGPFHVCDLDAPATLENLLRRLARALFDPELDDPHPWIRRARQECRGLGLPGIEGPRVRELASRLGNDLGQMRIGLDLGQVRAYAAYRDDNAHLWLEPEQDQPELELAAAAAPAPDDAPGGQTGPGTGAGAGEQALTEPPGAVRKVQQREWNHASGRYRQAWCTVHVGALAPAPGASAIPSPGAAEVRLARRIVSRAAGSRTVPASSGELGGADALVRFAVGRRLGHDAAARAWQRARADFASTALLVLLDVSASSAAPAPGRGGSLLDRTCALGLAVAEEAARRGGACAVWAFASDTRAGVRLWPLQTFGQGPRRAQLRQRMAQLQPRWSTRLGAVLRHAPRLFGSWCGVRQVVLVSDGDAHDIDAHDPRYLPRDAQQARRELRAAGIGLLRIDPGGHTSND